MNFMAHAQILSLSTVYPRPSEENLGVFVKSRLEHVARILPVKVVSPVPIVDYGAKGQRSHAIPQRRQDGEIEVFYPRWFYPPQGGFLNSWFLAARLIPFLRKLRRSYWFDVLDAHFGHPVGVAAGLTAAAINCPFTITLRGNETMHAQAAGRRRWMQWAFQRAARIITVSESLRQFAISIGADPRRVRTIPNGIDAKVFYPRPYLETRSRLGMPLDRPVILSAGYLIERKGHHRVVRALAELRAAGIPAELWIVGGPGREGRFEQEIHSVIRECGLADAVHVVGAVKAAVLSEYMSATDLFCLASSREGWPNVVHEALGCGAPVVATNVGGIPDMLPSPDYGLIIPPDDPAALVNALGNGLQKNWDRARISSWGRSRSWEQVAAETVAVLDEVVADSVKRIAQ
jgi:teichuronic acid biosynthesis glycosyltransferase TuaC